MTLRVSGEDARTGVVYVAWLREVLSVRRAGCPGYEYKSDRETHHSCSLCNSSSIDVSDGGDLTVNSNSSSIDVSAELKVDFEIR